MGNLPENIAIVYDRANKWGGAERLLEQIRQIFPTAHLITAVYHPRAVWAAKFAHIKTTFLQHLPFAKTHHDWFAWLTPLAFDTLDLSGYQLVISVTSADAKSVRTRPATLHICYCLTPTRYLWSHYSQYFRRPWLRLFTWPVLQYLRLWDKYSSTRPDVYLAISHLVANRIKSVYGYSAQVIYPASGLASRSPISSAPKTHFLWVGRLVEYKNPLLVAELFSRLPYQLVMVGNGKLFSSLKSRRYSNLTLTGEISDRQLADLYQTAYATIMLHQEDFGLVALESLSFGTPLITLADSGAAEIVKPGVNGYLLTKPELTQLSRACELVIRRPPSPAAVRASVADLTDLKFRRKFAKVVLKLWTAHQNTLSS